MEYGVACRKGADLSTERQRLASFVVRGVILKVSRSEAVV